MAVCKTCGQVIKRGLKDVKSVTKTGLKSTPGKVSVGFAGGSVYGKRKAKKSS